MNSVPVPEVDALVEGLRDAVPAWRSRPAGWPGSLRMEIEHIGIDGAVATIPRAPAYDHAENDHRGCRHIRYELMALGNK